MGIVTLGDAHPSDTFGMDSIIFAVADRDSALVPAGTASSSAAADVPLTAGSAAAAAAGNPGRDAPGSGRLISSRTAYSSRICALRNGPGDIRDAGGAHNHIKCLHPQRGESRLHKHQQHLTFVWILIFWLHGNSPRSFSVRTGTSKHAG